MTVFNSTSDQRDSWVAVAKGALIKWLGLYTDKPLVVKICPRHYGIKVRSYSTAPKTSPLMLMWTPRVFDGRLIRYAGSFARGMSSSPTVRPSRHTTATDQ